MLYICAMLTATIAAEDGRWTVHYVLPVSTTIDTFPAAGLRMFAAELLNDLNPGVIMVDGVTTPDGQNSLSICDDKLPCLAEQLAKLGVTQSLHLKALQSQTGTSIDLWATLIRQDRVFTQHVRCAPHWSDIRQKAAWAIIATRFQAMIADGLLPPSPQPDTDDTAADDLFIPLPRILDAPARTDIYLGIVPWNVNIPAGTYPQGSATGAADSQPRHTVTLPSFYMDKTEVPALAYAVCVLAGACTAPVSHSKDQYCSWGMPNGMLKPVNCVTWNQAREYCAFRNGRLPSEAEWEAAARGSDQRVYPWGNTLPDCDRAVFSLMQDSKRRDGCGTDSIWNTGMFPQGQSPFGLMDMSGNVWEWVADWYQPDAYRFRKEGTAPQGPEAGTLRVIRGGSWLSSTHSELTAWHRARRKPDKASNATGFRCAYDTPRNLSR